MNIFRQFRRLWQLPQQLEEAEKRLQQTINQESKLIMNIDDSMDQLITEVGDENTTLDGLETLLDGMNTRLQQALSGELTPAQVTKINNVFALVGAGRAKAAAAILRNTPQADPVPPVPKTPPAQDPAAFAGSHPDQAP